MPGNSAVLDSLLEALEERQKSRNPGGWYANGGERYGYKAGEAGSTPSGNYIHGPGGIFGVSGLERDVLSTRVAPRGIIGELRAQGSRVMNPLYPYITGFLAETGTDPDGVCDDPMTAGLIKGCLQTAQFGRYTYQTSTIELNRVGQQIDRGEFMDLRLVNDPLLRDMGGILSGFGGGMGTDINREVLSRWLELGVAFQNKLTRQAYQGNPSNNSAGDGYREFPGLDILIGTNKVDALTGTSCPSLDSDIKNFNYGLVDDSADADIVQVLTYLYRYLRHNADRMGFNPVEWVMTMREELFYEVTAVWPCSYLTYRCSFRDPDGQQRLNVDAGDAIAMRDDMRRGNYLLIDGMRVRVITDDGIAEETNTDTALIPSGQFASDIYIIPMAVRGGFATTFLQYLDYSGANGAMEAAVEGRYGQDYWTDGGRFLWHKKVPQNWCVQWLAKIEPRLILLTPQLAGRVQNVRYNPLQHTRSPFPSDPYFLDGGVTSRSGPSLYSDWNLPG